MSLHIVLSQAAVTDSKEIAEYLTDNADEMTAHRFSTALERAYGLLAAMPNMGAIRVIHGQRTQGMRIFLVPKFSNYLIFYQATDTQLIIRRVLHGARDTNSIIGGTVG